MESLAATIEPFIESIRSGKVEVYNEISLQHELGIFLREAIPGWKIQFERNVGYFFSDRSSFTKREIDIAGFRDGERHLGFVFELKYPRNGQHPEQMYSFCKDIAFLEELVGAGFQRAAFLAFAEDPRFYRGSADGIYGYFRASQPIHGRIAKPTGSQGGFVEVRGTYTATWTPVMADLRYTVIEVQDGS